MSFCKIDIPLSTKKTKVKKGIKWSIYGKSRIDKISENSAKK